MSAAATFEPAGENTGTRLSWILRAGVAACFIGHGSLGLFLYPAATGPWPSYFAVVGINHDAALTLMPWVGALDVALALTVLFYPVRALVLYMVAWCGWTALLRPLAGESFWEAVERAGNYGAPLALLLFMPGGGGKSWWGGRFSGFLETPRAQALSLILRGTTFLLLLGHGMLNCIVQKPVFATQYSLLGLPGATAGRAIGVFECLLALAVLLKPDRRLLLGVVVWKLATEALSPFAGAPFWVFVEHGGSYAAPLALAFLVSRPRSLAAPPCAAAA